MTGEGFQQTTARWRSLGLDTLSLSHLTFVPRHPSSNHRHWRILKNKMAASLCKCPFLYGLLFLLAFYQCSEGKPPPPPSPWICAFIHLTLENPWYLFRFFLNRSISRLYPWCIQTPVYGIIGEFYTAFFHVILKGSQSYTFRQD